MSKRDTLTLLHEAKRGRTLLTQEEYDRAWRDFQQLQSQLNECRKALAGYEDIRRCSFGVAGYHLNGEVAEWSEFDLPEVTSDG